MRGVLGTFSRRWEAGRWKDPVATALLVLRRVLSPFLYWDIIDIFETDLRQPLPQSYTNEKFDVVVYAGDFGPQKAIEDLTFLNRHPRDVNLRFATGEAVAIAYTANEPVGCMWLSFASGRELSLGARWVLNPNEALRHSSFVHPEWRGRAIHSLLNNALNRYALRRGIIRTLGDISLFNRESRSLAKHYRRVPAMRVLLIRLRGVNWTYRMGLGAPLRSRFVIKPCPVDRMARQRLTGLYSLGKFFRH